MSIDTKWFPLQGLARLEARFTHHPAPPAHPSEGTAQMPPIPAEQTAAVPGAAPSFADQLKAAAEAALLDIEARAEPLAELLVNEMLGKVPFGQFADPFADALIRLAAAKLVAKLAPAT